MGASQGNFHKYPRTPHLFGSTGTSDDQHLGEAESLRILLDDSLIVEEKLDGTNVGIHFLTGGELVLQCRGHLITEGMHPQYGLFKQWVAVKRNMLEETLGDRYILFGEWIYAKHSIHYRKAPHYFFEFDVFDKQRESFLDLERRLERIEGTGITTVPVVHHGKIQKEQLAKLIGPSRFDSCFENPTTGKPDNLMEGLYLRTEARGEVTARAKIVRSEFVAKVKQSEHWQRSPMTANLLDPSASIWT